MPNPQPTSSENLNDSTGGLPVEFLERLKRIVGEQHYIRVCESFRNPKKTSFRVNTLKSTPAAVRDQLSSEGIPSNPLAWCDHAFWIEPQFRDQLTRSSSAIEGNIYVQGQSSILAALILDPKPEQWNLDLAAAPGGKASHMVALMNNDGKLSVVEPIKKRMYRLADNLKRLGSTISKTYLMDGRKAGQKVPERFDCVLLDAPCSSESRMRSDNDDSHKFWSLRKIQEQSRKQAGLIVSAFETLKPGGTLLYSTCSFAVEENEAIVNHLLQKFGEQVEVMPIEFPDGFLEDNWQEGRIEFDGAQFEPNVSMTRRILPNEHFDGFFMAKIGKQWASD